MKKTQNIKEKEDDFDVDVDVKTPDIKTDNVEEEQFDSPIVIPEFKANEQTAEISMPKLKLPKGKPDILKPLKLPKKKPNILKHLRLPKKKPNILKKLLKKKNKRKKVVMRNKQKKIKKSKNISVKVGEIEDIKEESVGGIAGKRCSLYIDK
jgi:hypothetical protein